MDLDHLKLLLSRIEGCTFATIDSVTTPIKDTPGLRKVTKGTRIILYTNKEGSGYEKKVKRHLIEAGKNPDNFVLSDLPWGEKIPDTPLVVNRGKTYLQCIVLEPGQSCYYIGDREVDASYALRPRRTNQGLPPGSEVVVATYDVNSITRIALMGEVIVGDSQGIVPLQRPKQEC